MLRFNSLYLLLSTVSNNKHLDNLQLQYTILWNGHGHGHGETYLIFRSVTPVSLSTFLPGISAATVVSTFSVVAASGMYLESV